jgi:hypothetical protein
VAAETQLKADEAAMRDCYPQVGRLGDDRSVGAHVLDYRLGSDARLPQPGCGFEPGCRVSELAALPSKLAILVKSKPGSKA